MSHAKFNRFACRNGSILWEHARKSLRLTEGEYLFRECLMGVFIDYLRAEWLLFCSEGGSHKDTFYEVIARAKFSQWENACCVLENFVGV